MATISWSARSAASTSRAVAVRTVLAAKGRKMNAILEAMRDWGLSHG